MKHRGSTAPDRGRRAARHTVTRWRERVLPGLVAWSVTLAVMLVPAAPAAARSGYRPEPWQTWTQEGWTAPAGRYCAFPLQVSVVSQDVRTRVSARYGDGTVRLEEFAGPLTVDFTDTATGRSVRRDAGGSGVLEHRPDGSWLRYTIIGPAGFGFRPGDRYPLGYYLLDGLHVIALDAAGVRSMRVALGDQENVCDAIAAR
ncbi:hypothetical protein [Catellatospora methionotrophica]|uniref:hypothetical protein n=1 Tax=Catellatospora methionotrophica TaxID=121620 RepID=UPI001407E579|nr:hypothetical protein [Catellatospora methionotrophica]